MAEPTVPRKDLEEALTEAARAASRLSLMGALGFGVALLTGSTLARENGFFSVGFGLETVLFFGGLGGGVLFTVLALRASRMARSCRERLEEQRRSGR
ncbi:MAG: hypothetical protein ACRDPK_09245 [Carbonactinosporaceae bacterium]